MAKLPADGISRTITRVALGLSLFVVALFALWGMGLLAGRPALPLANKDGSKQAFPVSEGRALVAISNAFRLGRYNEMMLSEAVGGDWLAKDWHPTNGFVLQPTLEPTSRIPTKGFLGPRQLGYLAWFHITTSSISQTQTMVTVRTVLAEVVDGIALGHAGTTGRTVKTAPVRREEERVLAVISDQIAQANERN